MIMKRVWAVVVAVAVVTTTVWSMEPPARLPDGMMIHVAMRSPGETANRLLQFFIAATRGTELEEQAQGAMMMSMGAGMLFGFPAEMARADAAWHFALMIPEDFDGPPPLGFLVPVTNGGANIKAMGRADGGSTLISGIAEDMPAFRVFDVGADYLLFVPEDINTDPARLIAAAQGWKPAELADGVTLSITFDVANAHSATDDLVAMNLGYMQGQIDVMIDKPLPEDMPDVVRPLVMRGNAFIKKAPGYLEEIWSALGTIETLRVDMTAMDTGLRQRVWIAAREGTELATLARQAATLANTEVALAGRFPAAAATVSASRNMAMSPSTTDFLSRFLTDLGAVVDADTSRALGSIPAKMARFFPFDSAQAPVMSESGELLAGVTVFAVGDPAAYRAFLVNDACRPFVDAIATVLAMLEVPMSVSLETSETRTSGGVPCTLVEFVIESEVEEFLSGIDQGSGGMLVKRSEASRSLPLVFAVEGGNLFFAQGNDPMAGIDAAVNAFRAGGRAAMSARPGYAEAVAMLSQKRLGHSIVFVPDLVSLLGGQIMKMMPPELAMMMALPELSPGKAPLAIGSGADGRMFEIDTVLSVDTAREVIGASSQIFGIFMMLQMMGGGDGDDGKVKITIDDVQMEIDSVRLRDGETIALNVGGICHFIEDEKESIPYRWEYSISDEDVMSVVYDQNELDESRSNQMPGGDAGWRTVCFQAISPGECVIRVRYEDVRDAELYDGERIYTVMVID